MSVTIQKQRKKRSRKYKTKTQWKHDWKTEEVDDYGTFEEMYRKYGDKFQYWCAEVGVWYNSAYHTWEGYRLDGDQTVSYRMVDGKMKNVMNRTQWNMSRYRNHKAWISNDLVVEGKRVILVANAGDE